MSVASPNPAAVAPAAETPAAARRRAALNLARRPFVNTRPVVRVALLLWLLGALLLLGNISLFWRYLSGSREMRVELDRMESQVRDERQRISQLEQRIEGYDLTGQNDKVAYLNRKIDERTFSWSLLFDRIAEVLPDDVRLTRLSPRGVVEEEKGGRVVTRGGREEDGGRVVLTIAGAAKSDEALSRFVDNLYAHPSFEDPNPTRETRQEEEGVIEFDLTVYYQPAGAAAGGVVETPGRREPSVVVEEEPLPSATPTPAPPGETGGQTP
jgi:Tfp pilus assembly protein PilN